MPHAPEKRGELACQEDSTHGTVTLNHSDYFPHEYIVVLLGITIRHDHTIDVTLNSYRNHFQHELLTEFSILLRSKRKNRFDKINNKMIMKDLVTGHVGKLACDSQLPYRRGTVEDNQVHKTVLPLNEEIGTSVGSVYV